MKEFFKAFLAFGLATSIQKLLGFILLPIYTRYFDKIEYGIIDMVGTVLSVAIIFGVLQLETSLQRYYYEYKGLRRKLLVSNVYILISCASVFIAILLFVFAPYISLRLFEVTTYSNLIRLVSFQLPFSNMSMLGLVILRYEKENIKFLLVILVNVVLSLLFVYLFVILGALGLSGVFYAKLGAIICSSLLVTYFIRNNFIIRWSKKMTIQNIKYALPQFPARMGSIALSQANRFFIIAFLGLGPIGIYSVSFKLASAIQLANTAFILAWGPFMFQQFKKKNNKIVFANVFPIIAGIAFLLVSLITLISKEIVVLLTTEEFYQAHHYVGGLALFFALYIIKEVVDIGPRMTEKTKYLTYTFFVSVLVNLISLYFLTQAYHIEGVVFSMILTNLVLVIISWYVSNRLYYIAYSTIQFILMLIPTLVLVSTIMYYQFSATARILIAGGYFIYYSSFIFYNYRTYKQMSSKVISLTELPIR